MKTEIMYATECAITVYFNSDSEFASAEWSEHFKTLSEAISCAEDILGTQDDAERIIIWDANTGEILAECSPDSNREENYETPYDEWDDGDRWDLECGFDPYLGCYTDDC